MCIKMWNPYISDSQCPRKYLLKKLKKAVYVKEILTIDGQINMKVELM